MLMLHVAAVVADAMPLLDAYAIAPFDTLPLNVTPVVKAISLRRCLISNRAS